MNLSLGDDHKFLIGTEENVSIIHFILLSLTAVPDKISGCYARAYLEGGQGGHGPPMAPPKIGVRKKFSQ